MLLLVGEQVTQVSPDSTGPVHSVPSGPCVRRPAVQTTASRLASRDGKRMGLEQGCGEGGGGEVYKPESDRDNKSNTSQGDAHLCQTMTAR